MKIPASCLPYLRDQRTGCKGDLEQSYTADMMNVLDSMRPLLDSIPAPKRILDIGCGVAGIDVLLSKFYDHGVDLTLLDRDGIGSSKFGWHKSAADMAAYNDLKASAELLEVNGVPAHRIRTVNIDAQPFPDERYDLIISLLSWCFHYPAETYLDEVNRFLTAHGWLVVDIRKGTDGLAKLRPAFRKAMMLHDGAKHERWAFGK